jgi:hypothetical protein
MWDFLTTIGEGLKKLFGGKSNLQVGAGNVNVSGSTTGASSPSYVAARDIHITAPPPAAPSRPPLGELASRILRQAAAGDGTVVCIPSSPRTPTCAPSRA